MANIPHDYKISYILFPWQGAGIYRYCQRVQVTNFSINSSKKADVQKTFSNAIIVAAVTQREITISTDVLLYWLEDLGIHKCKIKVVWWKPENFVLCQKYTEKDIYVMYKERVQYRTVQIHNFSFINIH